MKRSYRNQRPGMVCRTALTAALLAAAACAPGMGAPAGAPVADPAAVVAELQRLSVPDGPRQVAFEWTLAESGARLRGRGVARLVAPERLRLDLFGPRGETYLSAALVGDEFHVPGALAGVIALPSPALLWAAVGVVQPPGDARLSSATATETELIVRYETDAGDTFEYRAAGEPQRLGTVSRAARGGVRETLQLNWGEDGALRSTRYRDVDAYRELVLTVESMTPVESFPPSIWRPDGTAR